MHVCSAVLLLSFVFFFQAEDGIRDLVRSRGLGDVYKRQVYTFGPVSSVNKRVHVRCTPVISEQVRLILNPDTFIESTMMLETIAVSYTHLTLPTIYSV